MIGGLGWSFWFSGRGEEGWRWFVTALDLPGESRAGDPCVRGDVGLLRRATPPGTRRWTSPSRTAIGGRRARTASGDGASGRGHDAPRGRRTSASATSPGRRALRPVARDVRQPAPTTGAARSSANAKGRAGGDPRRSRHRRTVHDRVGRALHRRRRRVGQGAGERRHRGSWPRTGATSPPRPPGSRAPGEAAVDLGLGGAEALFTARLGNYALIGRRHRGTPTRCTPRRSRSARPSASAAASRFTYNGRAMVRRADGRPRRGRECGRARAGDVPPLARRDGRGARARVARVRRRASGRPRSVRAVHHDGGARARPRDERGGVPGARVEGFAGVAAAEADGDPRRGAARRGATHSGHQVGGAPAGPASDVDRITAASARGVVGTTTSTPRRCAARSTAAPTAGGARRAGREVVDVGAPARHDEPRSTGRRELGEVLTRERAGPHQRRPRARAARSPRAGAPTG